MPVLLLLLLALPAQAAPPFVEASGADRVTPLSERFPTPEGASRVPVAAGSFAAWLRALPLRQDREHVLAHDGRTLDRPAAAIAALDVGRGDLQQCADSILRLHAEWLWSAGRADEAAYHFTSGDRSAWVDWAAGERFEIDGSRVRRRSGAARGDSWATYRGWLQYVFRFAGTRSLRHDSAPVPADRPLQAGDLFVEPGSPGHAVVLLDVVEHQGRRYALVGQGFMPAEDFHVLRSEAALDGVWFPLPGPGGTLDTPSWRPFRREDARRLR